jgi:sugar O-acyltransferase (sialic acid O-acetyltransferase NeuD family)
MRNLWVLFGFSDAIADQLDAIHSKKDQLDSVVLNVDIDAEQLERNLSVLDYKVNVVQIQNFTPRKGVKYNFAFFIPERMRLVQELKENYDLVFSNLVHNTAQMSKFALLGEGIAVGALSVVTAYAILENHVRINRSVSIGHHTRIGEYTHVSPGVTVAGHCHIGAACFIGAGSVIKDRIRIGKQTMVGAGSVVVKDIPEGVIVCGNPAKIIKSRLGRPSKTSK